MVLIAKASKRSLSRVILIYPSPEAVIICPNSPWSSGLLGA